MLSTLSTVDPNQSWQELLQQTQLWHFVFSCICANLFTAEYFIEKMLLIATHRVVASNNIVIAIDLTNKRAADLNNYKTVKELLLADM